MVQGGLDVAGNPESVTRDRSTSLSRRIGDAAEAFEKAWNSGSPPAIEEFLGGSSGSARTALLVELIMVDVERRWRAWNANGAKETVMPPLLAEYAARFPELGEASSIPDELVIHEYRVRLNWGDRPTRQEYLDRYGPCPALVSSLQQVEAQLDQVKFDTATIQAGRVDAGDTQSSRVLAKSAKCAPPETSSFRSAVLDRYEVSEELGRGGMGVVYRGRHLLLDKPVAIKLCLPQTEPERFRREAQLLARVSSPHIVIVHDFDLLSDGRAMLVMDWIDGADLMSLMRGTGGPLHEKRVLQWMKHVCLAMQTAAACGVVHRDLKPSNILIDKKDAAKVADFGLARSQDAAQLTASGGIWGTVDYMAPEQAEDPRSVDTRADIYSFGATFYHALTGQPPFKGETPFAVLYKHKTEPLIAPQSRNPRLSKRTSEVLERCLAKSPVDRFSQFSDVLDQLTNEQQQDPWLTDDDPQLTPILSAYTSKRLGYLNWYSKGSVGRTLCNEGRELDSIALPGGQFIRFIRGDIVKQQVDAIVSSADDHLSMEAGVSFAIRIAGGPHLRQAAEQLAPVRPGRAVITPAGNLACRFVIHAVTVGIHDNKWVRPSRALIADLVASCFYQADCHRISSIAFPLLGTGIQGFPTDESLDTMFRCILRLLTRELTSVREVRLVIWDGTSAECRFALDEFGTKAETNP
jgi:serine/threonine protein kinase/O-acetyl-ADP-ribose deacetylase (regulator of RNase III)